MLSRSSTIAIALCCSFAGLLLLSLLIWRCTRKVIVVAGLPLNFKENELLVSLPGAVGVRKIGNGLTAFVEFESNAAAKVLIARSLRELIYFRNNPLAVRFAYPFCFEVLCGPRPPASEQGGEPVAATTNPTFGVKDGAQLDDL